MNTKIYNFCFLLLCCTFIMAQSQNKKFPDGTEIPDWFFQNKKINPNELGKPYVITKYGVKENSTEIQTKTIQKVIDQASENGGGVIIIPKGTFYSGALFFKTNTKLYLSKNAVLKGSDNIDDYPIRPSRIEGQNLDYFPALINAYSVDGFVIAGNGTIDGNGLNYWKAFWKRREENKNCTNLEVSRPRLVFIWKSNNVQLQDVSLLNSGFWTTHFYQCNNIKVIGLHIFSPKEPIKAPSTDGIDLDVCKNVLIKNTYISVNDDAIALKGGKGPKANKDENNGPNENILIEDCEFGFCHAALTLGSEAIHNKNVIMRNTTVKDAERMLWLKLRGDTPQHYEYVLLDNIKGHAVRFLTAQPWNQFFDLKGETEIPKTFCNNITLKNMVLSCNTFFDVASNERNVLENFYFDNLKITADNPKLDKTQIKNLTLKNVFVNNQKIE